jgi:hypothetical protein
MDRGFRDTLLECGLERGLEFYQRDQRKGVH